MIVDKNEYESKPCENEGTCSNTFGRYGCSSPAGWTGATCGQGKYEKQLQILEQWEKVGRASATQMR